MKAGKSSAATGVLPSFTASSRMVSKVGSSVAMPRISSTSCITGTGFMKCMPMKRSGRSVAAASRVIEIDEVLEATIADGFRCGTSCLKISRLTCLALGGGLDDDVAFAEPCHSRWRSSMRASAACLVLLLDLAARNLAAEVAVDRLDAPAPAPWRRCRASRTS